MLEDGSDACLVSLLAFWHSRQTLRVLAGMCSEKFNVGNGTRQGCVLSPYLFTRFVRPLISAISPVAVLGWGHPYARDIYDAYKQESPAKARVSAR